MSPIWPGNERMAVGKPLFIITPSDPLGEFVFPLSSLSSAYLVILVSRKVVFAPENTTRDPLYFKSWLLLGSFSSFPKRRATKKNSHHAGGGNSLWLSEGGFIPAYCTRGLGRMHLTHKWSTGEALFLPSHILKVKKPSTAAIACLRLHRDGARATLPGKLLRLKRGTSGLP